LLAGWILLNVPDCIIAQEESSLVPGDRVRVKSTSFNVNKIVGSVGTIETDFFMLNVEEQPAPLNIPFSSVTRLEISQGRKAKTLTGGLCGLLLGAGVGALVGVTQQESFRARLCWVWQSYRFTVGYGGGYSYPYRALGGGNITLIRDKNTQLWISFSKMTYLSFPNYLDWVEI
jgi:hypothetical protein